MLFVCSHCFCLDVTTIPDKTNSREGRFTLAHSFQRFQSVTVGKAGQSSSVHGSQVVESDCIMADKEGIGGAGSVNNLQNLDFINKNF